MAKELASGKWMATRVESAGTKMKYFDTEEEARAYELGLTLTEYRRLKDEWFSGEVPPTERSGNADVR